MLLRHYLEHGTTRSALARRLGVSRDTIHRWIRDGDLDRDLDDTAVQYGPRRPVLTKLDRYRAILEEIRAAGYTGGYSQLTMLVRQLRPAPSPDAVVRFETPAGHQAQVDFAEFQFPWGTRYALLVVLGYSRLLWCRFGVRQDMRTLLTGLENAFLAFGGVPRELLFDQMKAVITRDLRLQGGALVRNPIACGSTPSSGRRRTPPRNRSPPPAAVGVRRWRRPEARPLVDLSDLQSADLSDFRPALTP
jgi:transposase